MPQVQLKSTVWREGNPPLVAGNPPSVPDDPPPPTRRDYWPVLCLSISGSAIVAVRIFFTLPPANTVWINALLGVMLALLFWFSVGQIYVRLTERESPS